MFNLYRAIVKNSGEVWENQSFRPLYRVIRCILRDAAGRRETMTIEIYRRDFKGDWEYIGMGNADFGIACVSGQFGRTVKNYIAHESAYVIGHSTRGL